MKNVTIVGNNIAAMMAAITSAKRGHKVTLINPSKRFGGHFGGVDFAGHNFDAGMTFLEFSSYSSSQSKDVSTYNPLRKNDIGRFTSLIKDVLEEYGSYHKIDTPRMYFDGKIFPDLYIANKLDCLLNLNIDTRNRMLGELDKITLNSIPLHARNKTKDLDYYKYSLEEVSIANHGETFHNLFIEPFCNRLAHQPSRSFSGLFHRILWLPLFYPETLKAFLQSKAELPESNFYYPDRPLSSIISNIEKKIHSISNISIVNKNINSLSEIETDKLIWADSQDSLLSLCNQTALYFNKASIALVFVLVNKQNLKSLFGTLFINDMDMPFRITNQSHCANEDSQVVRLCVEWNADNYNGEDFSKMTKESLYKLNIVDNIVDIKAMIFKNAVLLPTHKNVSMYQENNIKLRAINPDIELIGASAPFGATSFNDQVIQGLKAGSEI